MTDKDLAQLMLGIYDMVPVTFDVLVNGKTDDDVVWGAKVMDGATVIVLRGSVTFEDWMRDLNAFASPFSHAKLGPVHPGFLAGMEQAWQDIKAKTSGPRIVIGHSLGAARAAILTGLMVVDQQAPVLRVVWGEPKPGFEQLAKVIAGVNGRSYRNASKTAEDAHHDLVTDVPLTFPPEEYTHPHFLTDVSEPPASGDAWGPFAWHHMPLYAAATPAIEIQI